MTPKEAQQFYLDTLWALNPDLKLMRAMIATEKELGLDDD